MARFKESNEMAKKFMTEDFAKRDNLSLVNQCEHCHCPLEAPGLCLECQDPKNCEAGNNGDRCDGCARHLYELSHDL